MLLIVALSTMQLQKIKMLFLLYLYLTLCKAFCTKHLTENSSKIYVKENLDPSYVVININVRSANQF